MYLVHAIKYHFPKTLPSTFRSSQQSLLSSHTLAKCPAPHILLDLIIIIIFGDRYKSLSSPLLKSLQRVTVHFLTRSPIRPNYCLSNPHSKVKYITRPCLIWHLFTWEPENINIINGKRVLLLHSCSLKLCIVVCMWLSVFENDAVHSPVLWGGGEKNSVARGWHSI